MKDWGRSSLLLLSLKNVRLFLRGSFQKMKKDIEAGMIGKVVIKDYNRISRKNEDLAKVLDFLRTNGVEVAICN
jgi:site-specific DNA recombinase